MSQRLLLLALAALGLSACGPPGRPAEIAVPPYRFALDVVRTAGSAAPVQPQSAPGGAVSALPGAKDDASPSPTSSPGPAPGPSSSPSAAPASSGGGGSGSGPAPIVQVAGTVLAVSGPDETPLGNARVATDDGRVATTDANGNFTLSGPAPSDGVYIASHPGYATSLVTGLDGLQVQLHLQGQAGSTTHTSPNLTFTVRGQLLGPTGQPVVDAFVALAGADGTTSVPAVSGVNGNFSLPVSAPGGVVNNATLVAASRNGAFLGMASAVAVNSDQPTLAPLAMVAADHPVNVVLDSHVMGAITVPQSIDLVAADGTRMGISVQPGQAKVAAIPGARYSYRADAVDPANGATSTVYQDDLAIDFGTPETDLSYTLLAPPVFSAPQSLASGTTLSWQAVDGADAYHVSFTGTDTAGYVWEGFGVVPRMPLTFLKPLVAGHYDLVVAAYDGAGLEARAIASLGPRQLRVIAPAGSFRKSTRRVQVAV